MVNKGFPTFGTMQSGTLVSTLRNYNIPDFVLKMVAGACGSDLLEKGRINDRLQSMNGSALEMLNRVFVECRDDKEGRFSDMRFFAYVASTFHKAEVLLGESIPGKSGRSHRVQVAVRSNGMYVALAHNKATGSPVNRRDVGRLTKVAADVKDGDHGTQLGEFLMGSSVGFGDEALADIATFNGRRGRSLETSMVFKAAAFENNIYTVING